MKNILILNWRSINDPFSGGAEIATIAYAKRWVKYKNAKVTWVCPPPYKNSKSENIEGIDFEYIGRPLTKNIFTTLVNFPLFYLLVIYKYLTYYKNKVDIVIDEVHGIPYLTPLYVKNKKIILFIYEVAGEIWDIMYPFPINYIGKLLEKMVFRFYKKTQVVTGAESTVADLLKVGIPKKNINIIRPGINIPILKKNIEKEKNFTLMYLNRVVKMKGIERAIEIFSKVVKTDPAASFWIVGKGELNYVNYLENKCSELGIKNNVTFFGYVDQEKVIEMYTKAHVFINPSYKEGWGLVNIEANARGTPVVAFDVPGNRESVINKKSGFIVESGNLDEMTKKILEIRNDPEKFKEKCIEHASKFKWDILYEDFYKLLC